MPNFFSSFLKSVLAKNVMSGFFCIPSVSLKDYSETSSTKGVIRYICTAILILHLYIRYQSITLHHQPREEIFSPEQIKDLSALGDVLKQIRIRLEREGWVVEEGRIYKKSVTMNTNE